MMYIVLLLSISEAHNIFVGGNHIHLEHQETSHNNELALYDALDNLEEILVSGCIGSIRSTLGGFHNVRSIVLYEHHACIKIIRDHMMSGDHHFQKQECFISSSSRMINCVEMYISHGCRTRRCIVNAKSQLTTLTQSLGDNSAFILEWTSQIQRKIHYSVY
jgi:hypothetical protein